MIEVTAVDGTVRIAITDDHPLVRSGGFEATAQLVAARPDVRVLVLTTYESDENILAVIEAGTSGYLLKAAPQKEILAGLRSVAQGEVALAPSIAAALFVSEATVKTHLIHVFEKLEVKDRTRAVTKATVLGLLLRSS